MRVLSVPAGGAAASSRQAARQPRQASVPTARAPKTADSACWGAPRRRAWAPRAPTANGQGDAAAAAPPAAAVEAPPDFTKIPVSVEFVYSVDRRCTLRVSGPLSTDAAEKRLSDAGRGALLAAALVALHSRSRSMDAALTLARERFPGRLAAPMLKEFDRMQAAGEQRAALTVLSFGELFKLCKQVAPEVAQEVIEQIVAAAAQLQSSWLEPVPPDETGGTAGSAAGAAAAGAAAEAATGAAPPTAAGAAGDGAAVQQQQAFAFKVMQGIDPVALLPQQLVRTPQWQLWQRRLRGAVIAWQRKTAAEARSKQQEAGAAAAAEAAKGSATSRGVAAAGGDSPVAADSQAGQAAPAQPVQAQAKAPQPLQALYLIHSCTPDEVAMRHELRISVPRTEGIVLRKQLERAPHLVANLLPDPELVAALYAPEPLQQQYLQAAAFELLRLGRQLSFTCTLRGVAAPADGSSASSDNSSGGGGGDFEFGGSADELEVLVRVLAYLEGSTAGLDTFAWVPKDGRIQLRRLPPGGTNGWGRSRLRADGACFELAIRHAGDDSNADADGAHTTSVRQGQPALVQLTQEQLNALLDCLDAFCKQHPGFVQDLQDWDGPLWAPKPSWLQRLTSVWQRPASGSAAEGTAGGEGDGSSGEDGGSSGVASGSEASNSNSNSSDVAAGSGASDSTSTSTMGGTFV